jgi:hypothetical protein
LCDGNCALTEGSNNPSRELRLRKLPQREPKRPTHQTHIFREPRFGTNGRFPCADYSPVRHAGWRGDILTMRSSKLQAHKRIVVSTIGDAVFAKRTQLQLQHPRRSHTTSLLPDQQSPFSTPAWSAGQDGQNEVGLDNVSLLPVARTLHPRLDWPRTSGFRAMARRWWRDAHMLASVVIFDLP